MHIHTQKKTKQEKKTEKKKQTRKHKFEKKKKKKQNKNMLFFQVCVTFQNLNKVFAHSEVKKRSILCGLKKLHN